jgi:hypothetical protein
MGKLSSRTSSWLVGFFVSIAACTNASGFAGFASAQEAGQTPATTNGTTAANTNSTPAARFGALYGGAAGDHDGTLRLPPRPSRSPLFNGQFRYKPVDGSRAEYTQQYRSAFEKAYLSAYGAALKSEKRPTRPPQTSPKTTSPN